MRVRPHLPRPLVHPTRERYELALEEDAARVARLAARAAGCRRCRSALEPDPELGLLPPWTPAGDGAPVPWREALRIAIAPAAQPPPAAPAARRRGPSMALAGGALVALAALAALALAPAPGDAGPGSPLFRLRLVEENARVTLAPGGHQPSIEADLAASYLWQARLAGTRRDETAYLASMDRFFYWAGRLRADVRHADPSQRPDVSATLAAARALLPPPGKSGRNQQTTSRAESVLSNVQGIAQEGNGEHS